MANEITKVTDQNGVDHPFKDVAAFPRSEQAVLGAVNQWPTLASGYTYTQGGVTFTWLDDGSLEINGISTNDFYYYYVMSDPGLARLRGNWVARLKDVGSLSGAAFALYKNTSGSLVSLSASNTEASITLTDAEHASGKVGIYIGANKTFNHVIVKPVLYLADVPSDTPYIPYAMTNEQLTKVAGVVSNLDMSKGISSSGAYTDLNNVKTSGIYAVFGSALNKPADVSTIINGTLIVTHKTSLDDVTQTLINGNEGTIYVRTYATATGWSSWYKFTGTVVS